ncbi:MAG: glycerol-3-phosphate dehydrogenase/oxidase [Chloroflexia bacterium]
MSEKKRSASWAHIGGPWDVLIVGGGITGVGILREATRLGLRALLVEQRDFGWGTSSRSSKMVHGGLRYLKDGHIRLTWASVRERKRLLAEAPGLIDPMGFLIVSYHGDRPGPWTYRAGLSIYDLLALQWSHRAFPPEELQTLVPYLERDGLAAGFRYGDAQTDDARLVLRVVQEAIAAGGFALNGVRAEELLWKDGRVCGAWLRDLENGATARCYAAVVINATGAWADRLREQVGAPPRMRPLRGSHLVFPQEKLPVAEAVTFLHPVDRRPVFFFPWEGVTLVGTTDLDHERSLDEEPRIAPEEVAYLMAAVESECGCLGLGLDDVLATFSGVRPVIRSHRPCEPSQESRDHVVWQERGLLTVTGGKLTTFRLIALDALRAVRHLLPQVPEPDSRSPVLQPVSVGELGLERLEPATQRRLAGRYGAAAREVLACAREGELERIPGTPYLWAELRWSARAENVLHLDDLLLRRLRLGLLLPEGGAGLLPEIRSLCQKELGWDDERWEREEEAYRRLWRACYSLPSADLVPDWRGMAPTAVQAGRRAGRLRRLRSALARLGLAPANLLRRSRRSSPGPSKERR